MPKKPRKTLGDVNAPSCVLLRELIDTQSKDTIRKWCLDYARDKMLPLFEKHYPGDDRPRNTLSILRGQYIAAAVKAKKPCSVLAIRIHLIWRLSTTAKVSHFH